MSTFQVEVVALPAFEKHPNADTLFVTKIFDYPVIFNDANGFKEGDLVAYIPVDAQVPMTPEWEFLGDSERSHRIKAKKLRGIFSMGLLMPAPEGAKVGDNVAEQMGIVKYESPEPASLGGENEKDPGFLPCYTGVENYQRYSHILSPGDSIVLTEKIHGCVSSQTKIYKADGKQVKIRKISEGDYVLGMDSQGKVVPSLVTSVFNNGGADRWIKVKGKRRGAGKGPSYFVIRCTPEHKFWNPRLHDYVKADQLKTGDKVSVLRTDLELTPLHEQILLGKLLGDGNLHNTPTAAAIRWGQKATTPYAEWTAKQLGKMGDCYSRDYISGYGSQMKTFYSVFSYLIKQKFDSFYINNLKIVPDWVARSLSPIGLAFWYMDDGSLGHDSGQEDRANFAVCDFSRESCDILIRALKKFDINAVYYKDSGGYSRLRLNANDAEKLFLLIAPYIPDFMQYKLPLRYRGHSHWLPDPEDQYKPFLITQEIISVEDDVNHKSLRYDLQTETNNYFANGTLVHNCNARFLWHKDTNRLWVGSRTCIKKEDPNNLWWKVVDKHDLREKLATTPDLIFYGEVYGQVQDLKYGAEKNDLFLRFFDVFDINEGRYLDFDDAMAAIERAGLEAAPVLHRGPWNTDLLELAEGKSTLANNVREGFVVRPEKERFSDEVGRVILKMIGQGYHLRKGKKTEFH